MAMLKVAVVVCTLMVMIGAGMAKKPETDYCDVCSDHTMCRYPNPAPGRNCNQLVVRGVSEQDKEQILFSHNKARNTIALGKEKRGLGGGQPPASNMKKVVWNDELATFAQRWSDQCVPYDTDKCRDTAKTAVGQNVYTNFWLEQERNTTYDWEWTVRGGWLNTVERFNGSLVATDYTRTFFSPYYTQLAWAEAETIGCGHVFYKVSGSTWIYDGFTCNYGPAGNVEGQRMYKIGAAATQCAPGYKKDATFEGLCSKRRPSLPVKV